MYKFVSVLVGFYVLGLVASNAGLELFGHLLALTYLGLFLWHFRKPENKFKYFGLGPDHLLWFFWGIGILGALFTSGLSTGDRIEIVGEFRWILLFYSLFAIMLWMARQKSLERKLIWLFIAGGIIAFYACLQVYFGWDPFRNPPFMHPNDGTNLWRAKGFFRITMTYSYSFGMLFCFLASYLLLVHKKQKDLLSLTLYASLFIIGISLIFTFTRGLWISLGVASLFMAFLHSRKLFTSLLASALIVFGAAYFLAPKFKDRVDSITSLDSQSNYQRLDLWKANWEMFKDHPFLGVGYGRNQLMVEQYNWRIMGNKGFIGHAHNHFLQVLAGMGLLGFLTFLAIFGYFYFQAFATWKVADAQPLTRALALGSLGAQIVFHLGGMTESVLIDNECLHMFIFLHCCFLAQRALDPKVKGLGHVPA